jgi:hypothetical protein
MGAAERLANLQPDPIRLGFIPWVVRGLLASRSPRYSASP